MFDVREGQMCCGLAFTLKVCGGVVCFNQPQYVHNGWQLWNTLLNQ